MRDSIVDGELFSKMGKKRPHTIATKLLLSWLQGAFGWECVEHEVSIDLSPADNQANEPEPNIVVLNRGSLEFPESNPQPGDIVMMAEVSHTTLAFDLNRKAFLYARAGIQEYWVLDVTGRRLIVHRSPEAGRYRSVQAYSEQESIAPLAAPQSLVAVARVLPPA